MLTLTVSSSATVGPATISISGTSSSLTASTGIALTVTAPLCTTNGYNYARAITIDHTKVPNTDQTNFPFLFSTNDPLLATTANNGHVANPNGYDIIFTSDAAGQNPLPYEMEEYDPAHGQMIAWVQIPTLSHTSDTVIYLFYGNPNITTPQQNPAGVWTSNYLGVYHLTNVASGAAADSTANANNGVAQGIAAINGQIDGAGSFNGSNSNIQLPQLNIGNVMSASAWFQTTANGVIFGNANTTLGSSPGVYNPILYVGIDSLLRGGIDNGYEPPLASQGVVNDGKWHLAYYTSDGTTQNLYLDGKLQIFAFAGDNSNAHYFFGTDFTWGWAQSNWNWFYLSGAIDETRISNTALSADWIATEYANQSSPSTFYQLYSENFEGIVPSAIALYASQSEQFTAVNGCGTAAVSWSMPAGSPGTLASGGLYTAPASVSRRSRSQLPSSQPMVPRLAPRLFRSAPPSPSASLQYRSRLLQASPNSTSPLSATPTIPEWCGHLDTRGWVRSLQRDFSRPRLPLLSR